MRPIDQEAIGVHHSQVLLPMCPKDPWTGGPHALVVGLLAGLPRRGPSVVVAVDAVVDCEVLAMSTAAMAVAVSPEGKLVVEAEGVVVGEVHVAVQARAVFVRVVVQVVANGEGG